MRKCVLFCLLACSTLLASYKNYPPARDWVAELRAGVFLPLSKPIQKKFGHGWIEGEAEFTYRFAGPWAVWVNAGYSYNKRNSAHIELIPVSAGFKYLFSRQHIRPYLGIGPSYTFLHFKHYSPLTRERIYKNRFGFVAKSGIFLDLPHHWTIDLFLDYYYLRVKFQKAPTADVSGFRTGIGLGYKF